MHCGNKADNEPCHTANIVQEWYEEHGKEFMVLTWPPNSPDRNTIAHLWDVLEQKQSPIIGGLTSQLTGLKRCAANVLVQDTTGHI